MFTGIIEGPGTVKKLTRKGTDALIDIEAGIALGDVKEGDSIAINGVCLTATHISAPRFTADVSAETLSRSTLKKLKPGDRVNLEKALTLSTPLGGHFVLGHVDCVSTIIERTVKSGSIIFGFEIGRDQMRYVVQKGSVAVDGISLTVNRCEKTVFYVNIIPHTAGKTTLSFKKPGDEVNIETDILGKYIEKFIHPEGEVTMDFLSRQGFVK